MTTAALSAGTLTGDPVKNPEGDDLGKVEEIMIDLESGRIIYVVVSAGGFLGLGDKFFAVPWSLLQVDTEDEAVVIDLDKETLEEAPGFDKDNWPDPSDRTWLEDVYVYYDVDPFWPRVRQ